MAAGKGSVSEGYDYSVCADQYGDRGEQTATLTGGSHVGFGSGANTDG